MTAASWLRLIASARTALHRVVSSSDKVVRTVRKLVDLAGYGPDSINSSFYIGTDITEYSLILVIGHRDEYTPHSGSRVPRFLRFRRLCLCTFLGAVITIRFARKKRREDRIPIVNHRLDSFFSSPSPPPPSSRARARNEVTNVRLAF